MRPSALAVRGRLMAAADRRREAHFGVDSEGNIALGQLAIESENRALGFPYVPSPGLLVDTLLANVGEELNRFSFVDFGSGKGRVLLVAPHYPFREVVGVEFSPELHETAEANIRRYRSPQRRCPRVRSVCADAATFALPAPDCVLYFNNPFAEPVFARVLANVQAAHERSRGKLYVLYQQLAGELETDRTQKHRDAGALGVPSGASRPLSFSPLTLPTGLVRPADVRIRRSGLYVVASARLAPRPRRRGRKGDPYRKPRLSRNLALPATRQPGTAGKHGVRPKRSWLERTQPTGYRTDLMADWVRGINRLRGLLGSIFPTLEAAFDYSTRTPLILVAGLCTAAEIRAAGIEGVTARSRSRPGLAGRDHQDRGDAVTLADRAGRRAARRGRYRRADQAAGA